MHHLSGHLGEYGELHLIHPNTNTASLLHNFTSQGYNSIAGIAELSDDIWTVVTSNYTRTGGPQLGSSAIWTVDVSQHGNATVEKLIELPDAGMANGMAAVNDKTILFADSFHGNIGRVSIAANGSATYDVALESPNLVGNDSAPMSIGANGLKYHAPYLYWTQSWAGIVARAPIDATTGLRTGDDEILATEQYVADDLEVSPDGQTVYVTRPWAKTIVRIALPKKGGKPGEPQVILGGGGINVVAGVSAAKFGRGKKDKNVLYVNTSGGNIEDDGKGEVIEGGKVVAVYLGEEGTCS